jgi:hypothetical protein
MSWWEQPYPGGPMVPVVGFPRSVYPADAEPSYPASTSGPDVEAYKRTVSRAGRWPWQSFDRIYSDAFAHGKAGGNVGDSGVEGVQRQLGLQATGYIGEATFNGLRSIRIPAGLPHAGEPAMDANAQNLIAEAYELYHAKAPAKPQRQRALAEAQQWLGYVESPPNSNRTTFGAWYGMDGQPWCAMFLTYCFAIVGGGSPAFARGSRYAYVPYLVSDAQTRRYMLSVVTTPGAGDLVAYDWDGGDFDHVGIFESGSASSWTAIEGNTSASNQSNGGQVQRRERHKSDAREVVFIRAGEP